MIMNEATLEDVRLGLHTIAYEAMQDAEAQAELDLLRMEVPSTQAIESYNWLGMVPGMREWQGSRVAQGLRADGFKVTNKNFESTIALHEHDFLFDRLGQLKPRMAMMAVAAANHQRELIGSLINDNGACYDGKAFFATNHKEGKSGTIANLFDDVFGAAAVDKLRAAQRLFKNDQGKAVGSKPTHIWGGPKLEGAIDELRNPAVGASQRFKEYGKIIFDDIDSDTKWGLADLSKGVKPFLFQRVSQPGADVNGIRIRSLANPEGERAFMTGEVLFGVDYLGAAAYAFWQLMTMSTGDAS